MYDYLACMTIWVYDFTSITHSNMVHDSIHVWLNSYECMTIWVYDFTYINHSNMGHDSIYIWINSYECMTTYFVWLFDCTILHL